MGVGDQPKNTFLFSVLLSFYSSPSFVVLQFIVIFYTFCCKLPRVGCPSEHGINLFIY